MSCYVVVIETLDYGEVGMNLYKTEKSAKAAIRKQAIHLIEHEIKYMCAKESGYYVEFVVDNMEDVNELQSRGFRAKMF